MTMLRYMLAAVLLLVGFSIDAQAADDGVSIERVVGPEVPGKYKHPATIEELANGDLYIAYYGGDGPNGIGTKAAMVGWLLAEAVKADVGMFAKSNDAFLLDLADGATFAVNLVGTYGSTAYIYTG